MGKTNTRRVRADISYLSLRTARKPYRCETNHTGCAGLIAVGHPYVLSELPPNSEIGNTGWWRMRVCAPCGHVIPAKTAVRLHGYTTPVTEWLIWSNHHQAWWGPDGSGYRTHIAAAGRYALADTPQWLTRGCDCCRVPEALVPVPAASVLADPTRSPSTRASARSGPPARRSGPGGSTSTPPGRR